MASTKTTTASSAVAAFQKHLQLLALIAAVIVPLISNFGLSLIMSNIANDIMYVTAFNLLKNFITAFNLVDLFLIYAVLVNSLLRFGFKDSRGVFTLCLIRVFIIYASYIVIGAIITADFFSVLSANLYYCLINGSIDLLILGGVVVITMFLRSKFFAEKNTNITVKRFFDFKNPLIAVSAWVVVLISASLLSSCLINTFFSSLDALSIVMSYVQWITKTAVGYCIMWGVAKWLGSRWKAINRALSK